MDRQLRVPNGLIVLLSLWLIASPFLLSFAGSAGMWIAVVIGVIALVLGWLRYNNAEMPAILSWIVAVLGVLLIIAPFVLGMAGVTTLLWDYIVVGVGFIIFGVWSALAVRTPATV